MMHGQKNIKLDSTDWQSVWNGQVANVCTIAPLVQYYVAGVHTWRWFCWI